MEAVWISINSNKTVLENHDLLNREIKKEIDLLSNCLSKVKPEIEKRISDAELSFDIKLTNFVVVITDDFEAKVNKYTSRIESENETFGEFKVNITRQFEECVGNREIINANISEARKLNTEFKSQKLTITEVNNERKKIEDLSNEFTMIVNNLQEDVLKLRNGLNNTVVK